MHWHYSRRMPSGKLALIGVWERGKFIGSVMFGLGANNHMARAFGLAQTEACELVRVALCHHVASVTRIVAIAIRMLQRQSPGLRLIVSYADPAHDHVGGIYQAGNWIFDGQQSGQTEYLWHGKQHHGRSITSGARGSTVGLPKVKVPGKYRYLMPLDDAMHAQIEPLRKPYPKRAKQATTDVQSACGGAAPTCTLQTTIA